MEPLRVVVLVSEDVSDVYFANQLLKELNVVGVLIEQQYEKVRQGLLRRIFKGMKYLYAPWTVVKRMTDARMASAYYRMAGSVGREYFGEEGQDLKQVPQHCKVLRTQGKKAINQPEYVAWIRSLRPDVIAVCGTSILKEEILGIPAQGVLNLHGGLSQKYRGIWTTMWAVFNGEPEYVGATVHYVTPGIDDGDIVYQGRPVISLTDNPESLYAKVVRLGAEMMIQAIKNIHAGTVARYPLEEKGRLYLSRMVTPEVLNGSIHKVHSGVLQHYLQDKAVRDEKVIHVMRGIYPAS